jgi:hypothetical protein
VERQARCLHFDGSLAFTAYHFPFQGWERMIASGLAVRIFFLGLLFAAARYKGASIGVLALAHGLIDWLQGRRSSSAQNERISRGGLVLPHLLDVGGELFANGQIKVLGSGCRLASGRDQRLAFLSAYAHNQRSSGQQLLKEGGHRFIVFWRDLQ